MPEAFQRLLALSGPEVRPLNAQAALGAEVSPERSPFSHLVRHFLERFFRHESASADGDARAHFLTIAFAAGLPGFVVAIYLWPVYHPFIVWPPGSHLAGSAPPYWVQVNHHFFFVVYSFVAMGLATVFQWDLFFPDLLDVFVLGNLPVGERKVFLARVTALCILVLGFLIDANFLGPLVLPAATDPPDAPALIAGHTVAVLTGGLFSAAAVLALQSLLLTLFGERLFRRFSLFLQGALVAGLVLLLLLFPVLSGVVPASLQSGSRYVLWFPPFWFLGIYQSILEGTSAAAIYQKLANIGYMVTIIAVGLVLVAYPLAHLRKTRALIEGSSTPRSTRTPLQRPIAALLHLVALRSPEQRAVFHFISQTMLRLPRYRIYLVLYGGLGVAVVTSTVLRLHVVANEVRMSVSADGIRTSIGIIAFWVIVGLRTAFVSPGNQRGSWILGVVHGSPAHFESAIEHFSASYKWAFFASIGITLGCLVLLRQAAPAELLTWSATASELLAAVGMCVVLTDLFFLNLTVVPFTGEALPRQSNLAFTLLRYFTFFPAASMVSYMLVRGTEDNGQEFRIAIALTLIAHLWLRKRHSEVVKEYSAQLPVEEGEEDFLTRLGLKS